MKLKPLLLAVLAAGLGGSAALAQTHAIPQSLILGHKETLERLAELSRHKGAVGVEARKATELFTHHIAREQEFILPPLSLLPVLATGKVTPDMAWALPMTDRVKAEEEKIYQEHTQITDSMLALKAAAEKTHDHEAREFAESELGDSLGDLEIEVPTVLLIGQYLHDKLPAAH